MKWVNSQMDFSDQIFRSMMPFIDEMNQSIRKARSLVNVRNCAAILFVVILFHPLFLKTLPSLIHVLLAGIAFNVYRWLKQLDELFIGPRISSNYHDLRIRAYGGDIEAFKLPRYLTTGYGKKEISSQKYCELNVMLDDLPSSTRDYVSRLMNNDKKITYHELLKIIYFSIAQNESRQSNELVSIGELAKQQLTNRPVDENTTLPEAPADLGLSATLDEVGYADIKKNRRKISINPDE